MRGMRGDLCQQTSMLGDSFLVHECCQKQNAKDYRDHEKRTGGCTGCWPLPQATGTGLHKRFRHVVVLVSLYLLRKHQVLAGSSESRILNKAASDEIIWHCKHYTGRGVMKFYQSGEETWASQPRSPMAPPDWAFGQTVATARPTWSGSCGLMST